LRLEPAAKKIKYIYLANDVLLQSRKKAPAFAEAFQRGLFEAVLDIRDRCEEETLAQVCF
jgi:hypothetical protein